MAHLIGATRRALLASAMFATPAYAQTPAPQSPDVAADEQDIVVTAQRRSQRLQDVPVAVSAFQNAQLERLNITSSDQLAKITPGLSFTQSSFTPQPQIRGIGTRGLSAGEESTVPVFLDGMYQPYLLNGLFQLANVERIEVLKGPQSALYGRNATGGAINVITFDPNADFRAKLGLRYGRFNDVQATAYVGGGSDVLAAGVSLAFTRRDGYLHDVATDSDRGKVRTFSGRAKLVWTPTDRFKLKLIGAYSDNVDKLSSLGTPIDGNTIAQRYVPRPIIPVDHYTTAVGVDIPNAVKMTNVGFVADYDLDVATVNLVSSYAHLTQAYRNNNPTATTAPLYTGNIDVSAKSFYNELYVTSNGDGAFSWIVGGVYYNDDTHYPSYSITTVNVATRVATLTTHNNRITADSWAGYAQSTLKLTDRLSVSAAGRYTQETRGFDVRNFQSGSPAVRPAAIERATEVKYRRFTPSGNVNFRLARDANLYVKVSKAFKSGVFSAGGSSLAAASPETIVQYEFGAKTKPLPWLTANLAVYHSDYKGLQATARDPVTLTPVLQNAASATIRGAELELSARVSPDFTLQGGLALTRGRYDDFPGAQVTIPATTVDPAATSCAYGTGTPIGGNRTPFCDVSGNRIIRSPTVTANLGASYTWNLASSAITLTGNAQYQNHYYWDTLNRLVEPSRILIDVELAWKFNRNRTTVAVFGQNLANEYYNFSVLSSANVDLAQPALPRTIGVRLGVELRR